MVCVHTSPLDQPGTGDAGGLNVYVAGLARALALRGVEVDVLTRATGPGPATVQVAPGVRVLRVAAGPADAGKADLPPLLDAVTDAALRHPGLRPQGYDVVHAHYWLAGLVGRVVADRWGAPLVHTMHTMAKVKNATLGPGEAPEPERRVVGEERVVSTADALVASTAEEAADLVDLYGADPRRVHVVPPGVDLATFSPGPVPSLSDDAPSPARAGRAPARRAARAAVGLGADEQVVVFAGRVQPLKAPDVLVEMLAELRRQGRQVPGLVVVGGPSGDAGAVAALAAHAEAAGVADRLRLVPAVPQPELAAWFRAADVVAMPSRSESFGLVAAEAQACGTPVVATGVGGLRTVVADGVSGVLVRGHDPRLWAAAVGDLLADDDRRARLAAGARRRALAMGWDAAAEAMTAVYASSRMHPPGTPAGPEVPAAPTGPCGRMGA
jgi:D-inositol-3-phosphate glycosyltransferase